MDCAMIFAASWLCFPTPTGNVNPGDGVILLCAWNLGGWQSALAAACGSALSDLSNGFAIWAPGTALIKALTVLCAITVRKAAGKRAKTASLLLSAVCAELVMTAGYFLYEYFVLSYGKAALLNIPLNLTQGALATAVSLWGMKHLPFRKTEFFRPSADESHPNAE